MVPFHIALTLGEANIPISFENLYVPDGQEDSGMGGTNQLLFHLQDSTKCLNCRHTKILDLKSMVLFIVLQKML